MAWSLNLERWETRVPENQSRMWFWQWDTKVESFSSRQYSDEWCLCCLTKALKLGNLYITGISSHIPGGWSSRSGLYSSKTKPGSCRSLRALYKGTCLILRAVPLGSTYLSKALTVSTVLLGFRCLSKYWGERTTWTKVRCNSSTLGLRASVISFEEQDSKALPWTTNLACHHLPKCFNNRHTPPALAQFVYYKDYCFYFVFLIFLFLLFLFPFSAWSSMPSA